ncbi:MAG TPA: hypothetical protein VFI96_01715 [Longimicrobiaceae bacterium]|nr:hypothetical protein [Longimicrobiaceae bacterium]
MSVVAYPCPDLYHMIPHDEDARPCPRCGARWTNPSPVYQRFDLYPVVRSVRPAARESAGGSDGE